MKIKPNLDLSAIEKWKKHLYPPPHGEHPAAFGYVKKLPLRCAPGSSPDVGGAGAQETGMDSSADAFQKRLG